VHVNRPHSAPPRVTAAQLELLAGLADGASLQVLARQRGWSLRTLQRRLRETCDAIGVATPIEAVAWACRRQLI
jgi:DNA-binding NarL/FixJ family response regulator